MNKEEGAVTPEAQDTTFFFLTATFAASLCTLAASRDKGGTNPNHQNKLLNQAEQGVCYL